MGLEEVCRMITVLDPGRGRCSDGYERDADGY